MNEGVLQNFDIPAEYMTIMDLRIPKLHYELSEKQKKHLSKKKLNESVVNENATTVTFTYILT